MNPCGYPQSVRVMGDVRFVRGRCVSAPTYFACVLLVTGLGFAVVASFRPTLMHSLREWLGIERRPQATAGSFYTLRVAPLLEADCAGCHGARRQKGRLRLDSFAGVMQGGKHGAVIAAGDPKDSLLLARITLPSANEKAMPPEGKPPLSRDEVTVIKLWIAAGASGTQLVGDIKGAPKPVARIQFADVDEAAVESRRAQLAPTVQQLQARFPGAIAYESRTSADIEVNASVLGKLFGDAELATLAPVASRIVRLDLSGTSVSDASGSSIAQMKHLRVLRLADTRVTDRMIRALAGLGALQSITVSGTAATAESLLALKAKGVGVYDVQESPVEKY